MGPSDVYTGPFLLNFTSEVPKLNSRTCQLEQLEYGTKKNVSDRKSRDLLHQFVSILVNFLKCNWKNKKLNENTIKFCNT